MNAVADTRVADLVGHARALVFDFDGTLVDSNQIKRRAFEPCFKEFPEYRSEILEYCWSNNHLSRTEKFRHVYEKILGLSYTEDVAAMLYERFAEASTHQIISAPEIQGAERFLSRERGRRVMVLLSSTPHDILLHIVRKRRWEVYFEAIQGAPVAKGRWLAEFQKARRLGPREILFFGDTAEDAGAAQESGCNFIAVCRQTFIPDGLLSVADYTVLLDL